MDLYDLIKFGAALLFVLALMGGLALILKKFGLGHTGTTALGKRRLKVVEVMPLDARRKLVLFQRDDQEHLVIIGPTSETVIESNIQRLSSESNEGT